MMSMMHNQINRAITTAINERVIPEIQNIASSMSSAGHRDTEASLSPNSQENRESASGPKMKFARKYSRSVGDLRDTTGHDSHMRGIYTSIQRSGQRIVPTLVNLKRYKSSTLVGFNPHRLLGCRVTEGCSIENSTGFEILY